jgi:multicomponent Na+:H+ antiporter subunit B
MSLIFSTATRYLLALLLLFSIYLLLRGHNAPGGGFVGGLVASAAFVLYAFAFDVDSARRALRIDSRFFIGGGLLVAVGSGLLSVIGRFPFMTGLWFQQPVPILGKIGTPVIFDVGVYLVVLGVVLTIIFTLAEGE